MAAELTDGAARAARLDGLASWHADGWRGLRVAVLGLGVTGFAVADTLAELGSAVTVFARDHDDERARILDVIGVGFVVHPLALWEDPEEDDRAIAWSKGFRELMAPYATGSSYLNFLGDEGADRVRAAFGASHDRLRRIKAGWDPRNVFRGNQNIPPVG